MGDAGYRIVAGVVAAEECERIGAALAGVERGRAGARHLMRVPEVRALAEDARLIGIAARELGGRAVPFRATLFEKDLRANWLVPWHQDTALPLRERVEAEGWGPWSVKQGVLFARAPGWALERVVALRVHLDDSTMENGPLRVIAGSHCGGVLGENCVRAFASTHDSVECVVEQGGVIVMRPLVVHGSSKVRGAGARRVLHIEFADTLELGAGVCLAEC